MRITQAREAFRFYLPRNINIKSKITKHISDAEVTEMLSCIGMGVDSAHAAVYETNNFTFSFQRLNLSEWLVTIKPL